MSIEIDPNPHELYFCLSIIYKLVSNSTSSSYNLPLFILYSYLIVLSDICGIIFPGFRAGLAHEGTKRDVEYVHVLGPYVVVAAVVVDAPALTYASASSYGVVVADVIAHADVSAPGDGSSVSGSNAAVDWQ